MTNLNMLKKEVEILHKALITDNTDKINLEITEKCMFYTDKLIKISRLMLEGTQPNNEELEKLNLEIAEFNAKHPASPDDLIRLKPYLPVINEVANRYF